VSTNLIGKPQRYLGRTAKERLALRFGAEELATKVPPLLVAAERVAATVLQGVHGRRRVGQGETFWQYRRYGVGDAATQIDWRQSARNQHVYVRENEWEAAQSVWLWADSSASMHYTSSTDLPTKSDRARLLLLALASMLTRGRERFAFLGGGSLPSTGRGALLNLTDLLLTSSDPTGLPPMENLPRDGHVVLIGDFLDTASRVRDAVLDLAKQGVSGHMIHLLDPAELELPFDGRVRFHGMERDTEILINRVEAVRSNYKGRIEGHCAAIREIGLDTGWNVIGHRTDGSPEPCLLSLFLAMAPMVGQ
jgi:uncharacterized protein (DUF58 family)